MGYPGQTARCATRSELDPAYDSPVTNSQTRCHPTHIPVETAMLRVDFGVAPGFEFPFHTFSLFANARFGFKLGPMANTRGPARTLETERLRPDHF